MFFWLLALLRVFPLCHFGLPTQIETNVGSSAVNTSSGMLDAMLNHNVDGVPRKLTLNGTYHPHFNRDMAKAFITSNKELDQPFFMYLPMMLAHGPLEDKPNDPSLPPGTDVPPDANDLFNERLGECFVFVCVCLSLCLSAVRVCVSFPFSLSLDLSLSRPLFPPTKPVAPCRVRCSDR